MKKLIYFCMTLLFIAGIWACDDSPFEGCENPTDKITVTGPITGGEGIPQSATILDLSAKTEADEIFSPHAEYIEQEFFFEGQAASYEVVGTATNDGKWTVEEADESPFKTRLLVRRPTSAAAFNGTVIVEWLNVSSGADGAPGFMFNYDLIMREGFAWVGVSAQKVGVEGGGIAMMASALPLKTFDSVRYGTLNHPGDAYSFDIFSTAAKVVLGKGSADVLGGLKPQRLLAYGESQSAMTMITYANAVQPVANVFDGSFIHSRAAIGVPLNGNQGGCEMISGATALNVRTDTKVPVFQFETEGDVTGFYTARQEDTAMIRTWEVAGTAHADAYLGTYFQKAKPGAPMPDEVLTCDDANEGPQWIVLRAALRSLNLWVKDGVEPPKAQPITMNRAQIARDDDGNALGGIRTPYVDVPIAEYLPQNTNLAGQGCDAMMCALFGGTEPFTDARLNELYASHEDYVQKFTASANEAAAAGFILETELQQIIADAQASDIP